MDPIVIGRVDNPEELDLDPLDVTIVGYTLEHEEVAETFRVRPVQPAGAALEVLSQMDGNGNIGLSAILNFVDKALLEADQAPFKTFLNRDDVMIEQGTLITLYQQLSEFYSSRPTKRRSASPPSGSRPKRTTRGDARSKASRSKTSRST